MPDPRLGVCLFALPSGANASESRDGDPGLAHPACGERLVAVAALLVSPLSSFRLLGCLSARGLTQLRLLPRLAPPGRNRSAGSHPLRLCVHLSSCPAPPHRPSSPPARPAPPRVAPGLAGGPGGGQPRARPPALRCLVRRLHHAAHPAAPRQGAGESVPRQRGPAWARGSPRSPRRLGPRKETVRGA